MDLTQLPASISIRLCQLNPTFAMTNTALDLAGAITILALRRRGSQAPL